MRSVLALLTVAVMLALTTSAALADPPIDGTVSQKFTSSEGGSLIAVNGTIHAVPFEFYNQVQVGETVQFDGMNWTIVK